MMARIPARVHSADSGGEERKVVSSNAANIVPLVASFA